eukprot:1368380-Pyramimonas_sp.AAC.1
MIFGKLAVIHRPANLDSAAVIWSVVDCPHHSQHSREMITNLDQIMEITPHLLENDGRDKVRFDEDIVNPVIGAILHKGETAGLSVPAPVGVRESGGGDKPKFARELVKAGARDILFPHPSSIPRSSGRNATNPRISVDRHDVD